MLARDYLNLLQVRLNNGDCWVHPPDPCLKFIFPTGGNGYLRLEPSLCRGSFGTGHTGATHPLVSATLFAGLNLSPGDVLVLNGASQVTLCNQPLASTFTFSIFTLCIEHLFPLFAGRDVALLDTIKDLFKGPRHYAAATPVALECHKLLLDLPPQFDLDHRSQLLRAAAAVLALEFKAARAQRSGFIRVEEHINQVLEGLSVHEILHASVRELAKRFGCTPRHLNRLFHQHLGCSVASFKMEMRLLKAASQLCDPSAKVVQVAAQCGFNFLGQFNACFKRRFGMSPSQWRQAHPGEAPAPAAALQPDAACRMRGLGLCPWCVERDEPARREPGAVES